jgi:Putative phage serine protease XkdF
MIKDRNIDELFELVLIDEEDGVFANSLVAAGAIERDFIAFHKEYQFAAVSDEKMIVAGPMLIPNKKILRLKEDGTKYNVFFTADTIEKIARKFMKNKFGDQVTLEHGNKTSGVYMVESWIVEHPTKDKSNLYGFTLPKGTWFALYSVAENPKVWDRVKAGEFNGFSIEGLFEHRKSDMKLSLEKNIEDLTEEEAEVFLGQLKAIIRKDKRFRSKQRIEMESYSDYPDAVKNAAKRALEWADTNGWGSCGTPVGKQRANQLAKGEPISVDTIKRMYSYVSRHEVDLETSTSYSEGCGKLMMDAWGGLAAGRWAKSKLKELGLLEETEAQPSITSTYPGQAASQRKKKNDK